MTFMAKFPCLMVQTFYSWFNQFNPHVFPGQNMSELATESPVFLGAPVASSDTGGQVLPISLLHGASLMTNNTALLYGGVAFVSMMLGIWTAITMVEWLPSINETEISHFLCDIFY